MSVEGGGLPTVGPRLRALWGSGKFTRKRREKVYLWSAVALQEHFARGAKVDCPLPTLEEVPAPLPGGRLTLAQKMGLVPLPPQPPSDDEWSLIEDTVLRRIRTRPLGSNVCCICQEAFYATMEQGQVLLNCLHVFHEKCLQQFERFTRNMGGRYDTTRPCCPMCRNPHYHKRVFYAGKAMEQRAAIVKIQAFFRRVLARKLYVKMRVESDSQFCGEYATKRLARLSEALAAYAEAREKKQAQLFDAIAIRIQRARAECTTPAEFELLRKKLEESSCDGVDCPICLSKLKANPERLDRARGPSAEEIVASLRKEYEERRAQKKSPVELPPGYPTSDVAYAGPHCRLKPTDQTEVKKTTKRSQLKPQLKPLPTHTIGHSMVKKKVKAEAFPSVSNTANARTPPPPNNTPRGAVNNVPASDDRSRYGVLLSCGHCFHDACLSTFERYVEMAAVRGEGDTLIPTCPLCRKAYIKVEY